MNFNSRRLDRVVCFRGVGSLAVLVIMVGKQVRFYKLPAILDHLDSE